VVTGGTKGIGLAIVKKLASAGYLVTAVARHESSEPLPLGADTMLGDLGDSKFRQAVAARFSGGLDLLMNNAGIYVNGPLEDMTDDLINEMLGTNLIAAISLTRALLPRMPSSGAIGFMGSKAGLQANANESVYCASKFGLRGFYESLRSLPADQRPKVVALEPSSVNTWGEPEPNDLLTPSQMADLFYAAVELAAPAKFVRLEVRGIE
jgi:NAD(P)-dependent dehydrogenase (short-subunit alcohol dehydrogenase family)